MSEEITEEIIKELIEQGLQDELPAHLNGNSATEEIRQLETRLEEVEFRNNRPETEEPTMSMCANTTEYYKRLSEIQAGELEALRKTAQYWKEQARSITDYSETQQKEIKELRARVAELERHDIDKLIEENAKSKVALIKAWADAWFRKGEGRTKSHDLAWLTYLKNIEVEPCELCIKDFESRVKNGSSLFQPCHNGSASCKSGSIASGGTKSHCSCDTCF